MSKWRVCLQYADNLLAINGTKEESETNLAQIKDHIRDCGFRDILELGSNIIVTFERLDYVYMEEVK